MNQRVNKTLLYLGTPLTFLAAVWLRFVKMQGPGKRGYKIFMKLGILPVVEHYYQPLINPEKHLKKSLREDRDLPGIDFNTEEQLTLLSKFDYNDELVHFPVEQQNEGEYFYNNLFYSSGDAEYFYNVIRYFKPKRIIEIGSGYSTLMARNAISKNQEEDTDYLCYHICIEPYEQPWLEKLDIELIREKVEDIDPAIFQKLEDGDVLFIDSSHIIKPQGDVLFEYLQILPTLKSGVLIHIHDIFSPKDYLDEWIFDRHYLWNEQYLLEAFLTFNSEFKIIGALNYLSHHHREELMSKCPLFKDQLGHEKIKNEPRAFWLIKK